MSGSDGQSAADYRLTGGDRIPDETYEELVAHYQLEERGGHLVFIEAHKRPTAKLVASRYKKDSDTHANVWNGSQVAVWTNSVDVVDDLAATIPDRDVIDEIKAHGDSDERSDAVLECPSCGESDWDTDGPTNCEECGYQPRYSRRQEIEEVLQA